MQLASEAGAFDRPVDCPHKRCDALVFGRTELQRLARAERELKESLTREHQLRLETTELLRQKALLSSESDHRLLNG